MKRTSFAVGAVLLSSLAGAQWSADLKVSFDRGVRLEPVLSYRILKIPNVVLLGDLDVYGLTTVTGSRVDNAGTALARSFDLTTDGRLSGKLGLAFLVEEDRRPRVSLFVGFSLKVN